MELDKLKQGQVLNNNDIIATFKCSARGGMRRSKRMNSLVLISDATKVYKDRWDSNNVLHYTGMGLIGNQSLEFMQNKTLRDSNTNGVDIHLFEVFEEGKYIRA